MSRSRLISFLVLVLLAAAPALAQRGMVRGQITDPDGNPLEGVEVSFELADGGGAATTASTNDDGRFTKPGVRLGNYRVSFELEGYEPLQVFVTVGSAPALIDQVMNPLPEGVLSQRQAAEADFHLQEGNAAMAAADFERAAEAFRGFLALVPDSGAAWFNLGSALQRGGDQAQAIEAYEKAAELDPQMRQGLLSVAGMYGGMQDWERAMATYDRVLDLIENDAVTLFNYAVFASNAENDGVAADFFVRATTVNPDFAVAYFQLGMLKYRIEDYGAARAAFARYLELEPESPQAETVKNLMEGLPPGA